MAAGLGFKTFTTGEVLTAADVNGYLMQGVLVFASEAARDAAITSPQEGQFAFTKDNNSLWYYSGSAWVASGATGDIEGVTAGTGISGGGTSGTVTITNSMATEIDAKGDLVVGTGADTFARLAVGTNDYVLTAASGETTGLIWAAPASSSGPAFRAYRATTDQSISRQTLTKVEFNGETFDTASCFDSTTNYRFTPNVAGYYQYNWRVNIGGLTGTQLTELQLNGTRTGRGSVASQDGVYNFGISVGSDILYMNGTTDYVEVYVYVEQASGTVFINEDANGADTAFSGVWIRS
jgi:hypothetical protein